MNWNRVVLVGIFVLGIGCSRVPETPLTWTQTILAVAPTVHFRDSLDRCKKLLKHFTNLPKIVHSDELPTGMYYYASDTVYLPSLKTFPMPTTYYWILFHEIGHALAGPHRADLKLTYPEGEIFAAFASARLSQECDIHEINFWSDTAYINAWSDHLSEGLQPKGETLEEIERAVSRLVDQALVSGVWDVEATPTRQQSVSDGASSDSGSVCEGETK